ncbi:hypothetical protein [uncultured Pseudokineococcus sp.]|uniref:hypothetical protein n=1 Tax=uncultured Pseudokineococcus sp. TaxID=1642928 RepID=UPI002617109D|nr:hypothetical protein [uncultured Pseudokineococcus sp.]
MVPDVPVLIVAALVYLALIALGLFVSYWVVRLAVQHGSLDARRRWRDQEERVQHQLSSEGYPEG